MLYHAQETGLAEVASGLSELGLAPGGKEMVGTDVAAQGVIATPAHDVHGRTGTNLHRVTGEHVRDDLETKFLLTRVVHTGECPEELLAAAHAACFSMALSAGLARAGTPRSRSLRRKPAQSSLGGGRKTPRDIFRVIPSSPLSQRPIISMTAPRTPFSSLGGMRTGSQQVSPRPPAAKPPGGRRPGTPARVGPLQAPGPAHGRGLANVLAQRGAHRA